MTILSQIAKQIRDLYFGGNWTDVNFKSSVSGLTWQEATKKIYGLNTIAILIYHTNYYIEAVLKVLKGGPLDAHDKFSFELPPIHTQNDWDKLLQKTFNNAEELATQTELLPERELFETFCDEKYGNYYRNLTGIIEHSHYHLGQIIIIKKIIKSSE